MSTPKLKIYDSKQVTFTAFGLLIDSGYAEGEFLRIEQVTADFTTKAGTDGEVTRSKTNDRRVKITVTLMQTSEGNAKLSAVSNLDLAANNGAGVGPFLVKDRNGTSLHVGVCWVAEPPQVVYANEAEGRAWVLEGILSKRFDGGT